jgi:hypothetical protein
MERDLLKQDETGKRYERGLAHAHRRQVGACWLIEYGASMRAKKFECGLLILAALSGPMAMADSGAGTGAIPMAAVVADVRPHRAQVVPRAVASPAQVMPRVEEIQFAGLSPAVDVRAATLDGQPERGSSTKDLLALILIAGMLVAYQLLRKHRLLRQQPFSL